MEQEHLFILDLVETGKITVPEAIGLIEAVDDFDLAKDESPAGSCEKTITIHLLLN